MFGPAGERALAAANSAARVLGDGATTIHAGMMCTRKRKFDVRSLARSKCADQLATEWTPVELMVLDEVSQVPANLFHALAYVVTTGRKEAHRLEVKKYHSEPFGRIPAVALLTDFLQLPPVGSKGLVDHHNKWRGANVIEINGAWELYKCATDCVVLTENKRFEDDLLPALLEAMRHPDAGSRKIPDKIWGEFRKTWIEESRGENVARLDRSPWLDGVFVAIEWQIVARELLWRAKRDAARSGQILHYVVACDRCKSRLTREGRHDLLQVANMTKTGRMAGILLIFLGARARLTQRISRAHSLVQDAPGTIVGIEYHPKEDTYWQRNDDPAAAKNGFVVLKYMPSAIHVSFDGHVPDEATGFEGTCFDNGHPPGVFAVEPQKVSASAQLRRSATRRPISVTFSRTQLPLMPEAMRTSYSCQGITTEHITIDCARPKWLRGADRLDHEYWIHLYVMLSRARSMKKMIIFNPPPREILEAGPPEVVWKELLRLRELAISTKPRVAQDRIYLGWPQRQDVDASPIYVPPHTEKTQQERTQIRRRGRTPSPSTKYTTG